MKNKIKRYYQLKRKEKILDEQISVLRNERDNIFFSKFNTNGKWLDGKAILDVFLKHPEKEFDRWDARRRASGYWSKDSMDENINYIFKTLYNEGTIIRIGNGYYKLNPEFVNTIKRNTIKEI